MMNILIVASACVALSLAADQYTTPVPILKQINRHNEDGSYSYGYENADGSFKIETKYATGEVQGKYGYVDDTGKLREIEYGASKRGFEPAGTDINVPPPTLNNNNPYPLGPNEQDDGQYREDPAVYYKDNKYNTAPASRPAYVAPQSNNYNPGPNQYFRNNPVQQQAAPVQRNNYDNYEPAPQYSKFKFAPQQQEPVYNPQPRQYEPQPYYNQNQHRFNQNQYSGNDFRGHPATNLDLNTGSYSLTYTG